MAIAVEVVVTLVTSAMVAALLQRQALHQSTSETSVTVRRVLRRRPLQQTSATSVLPQMLRCSLVAAARLTSVTSAMLQRWHLCPHLQRTMGLGTLVVNHQLLLLLLRRPMIALETSATRLLHQHPHQLCQVQRTLVTLELRCRMLL